MVAFDPVSFLPSFNLCFRSSPTIPTVPRHAPLLALLAALHLKLSCLMKLIVLHNDGRPAGSQAKMDCIVVSGLVRVSWQFPRWALQGPWTVANTV